MTEFISGQPANIAHKAIKSSLKIRDKAQQCAVLWFEDILNRKLYCDLGYSSINQYAQVELGFSKSHTGEFLALCRTFKRLPKMKEKVQAGALTYTSARVLSPVMDEKNQDEWLKLAGTKSRRELVHEVKRARQDALEKAVGQKSLLPVPAKSLPVAVVPVRVNIEMSPTQFARYEKLWEQVRKQRDASPDKVEAMLEIMESYVKNECPPGTKRSARADLSTGGKPPVQIHIHKCPDCEKATVQTSKGELEIGASELDRALCDCQIVEAGKGDSSCSSSRNTSRNTSTIPPAVRRHVLASARHKCENPGCGHTRFLEVHHKVPRRLGGSNDPTNLAVLCSLCHKLLHERNLLATGFMVKSPMEVYRWNNMR